jgi:hypothetical protein
MSSLYPTSPTLSARKSTSRTASQPQLSQWAAVTLPQVMVKKTEETESRAVTGEAAARAGSRGNRKHEHDSAGHTNKELGIGVVTDARL